ncbi:MAG: flagellar hook-basal body complex protein [Pseudomonadota bacterium]
MGIFGAMTTAISGLRGQSTALEHISGNIANSQTPGFKRTDTSFTDLVQDLPWWRQQSGSVQANSRPTNTVQGDIQNAAVPTYMAINGDGFFVVEDQVDFIDGNPIFSGVDRYTRRGDFEQDRNGYLVNGGGYFLKGLPIDPVTGNTSGSQPEQIQISNDFLAAQQTTEATLRANLADFPLTASADPDVPNSELLSAALLDANNDITGANATNFLDQSIAGGAVTVYDAGGGPVNVQFRWAKMDSTENGGVDTWNLFYLEDASATGTDVVWRNVDTDYVFNASGQLDPPVLSAALTGLSVNGTPVGDITLQHGSNGITQFADPNGNAQVTELSQNGYAAGELVGVSISSAGRVTASYTNGRTVDLYQVVLANFNAANRLQQMDGGAFSATQDSGPPILGGEAGVVGSALEGSNTDIADEFTKLIVTQQAYAAGTRIVTTSDEMIQEALNMIR